MQELVAALLFVAAVSSPLLLVRYPSPIARPIAATVGSLAIAYGGREFLRALDGGYYCCSHAYYAFLGSVIVLAGWVALVPALGAGSPALSPGSTDSDSKRSP